MGTVAPIARPGYEALCDEAVQRVENQGAQPGSTWSTIEKALGSACAPSSQTFRHDSLLAFEWSSWTAEMWCAGDSSKQAFATPEANANTHTINNTHVVMRFVQVPVEISMVNASCLRTMLRTYLDKSIDLCQKNHEMRATG